MAIDFPDSPTIGDTHVSSGRTWEWDGTVWLSVEPVPSFSYVGDTPPDNPQTGSGWFDSSSARFFVYYDNFWVEVGTSTTILTANSPLTYNSETATMSINLSSYDTSSQVDQKINEVGSALISPFLLMGA